MPKKTIRQTEPSADEIPSDGMVEAERRIAEARQTNAAKLDLSGLDLKELPTELGSLHQLRVLQLSDNQLRGETAVLVKLRQLQELNLSSNQLQEVPTVLGSLQKLKVLLLGNNQLSSIPVALGDLQSLQSLDITRNQLREVPATIGKLRQLKKLILWFNQIDRIHSALFGLENLLMLQLGRNKLTSLPKEIRGLVQLQDLYIWENLIEELPAEIGALQHLRKLYAQKNKLREIPSDIRLLQQLEEASFAHNHLIGIPNTIYECKNLILLYLHENPSLGIPIEILGDDGGGVTEKRKNANPADILNYYFRPKRPLLESKLILVGRGEVGKTSLINRLVHNTFGKEQKTDGIKITRWDVPLPHCQDIAHLNVWDFGGQEIMHATHQFFLTRRSLYALVLAGRGGTEDQDAEYWLKLIESFGGGSPVLVVLNKQREHRFDVNRRQLQGKYPFIKGFIETDCADRMGIDELERRIKEEINTLPHLRDGFPAEWFEVKDKLPGVRKSFISFDEYRKNCRKWKVKSEAEQKLLGRYLHDLGVMLNFREDDRLQDTHVLKPQWVTEGIYTILNSPLLAGQKGELRLRDLQRILPAKSYPVNMHGFVMDLMKKFELCFTFPDSDTHYLVPELLDKQEPEAAAEFFIDGRPAKCLNFRYEYEVLPEGLLPRFIVRTHGLIEDELRWRTGVILRFEEGRALVKADVVDKRVFIHVTGKAEARRRLLGIIRSDFERIHKDLKFEPAELVPLHDYPDEAVTYADLRVYEDSGMTTFPKVIGKQVVQVDVQELLNGVDLEGTRRRDDKREALVEMREEPMRVFISYAHKDERFRLALEPHLKLLQRQGLIATWHDRLIKPGTEWADVIDANLEQARIILLLVSADFIASDYCWEKEMSRALERHEKKEARVIPVIIRDCQWDAAPFAKLQALPHKAQSVDKWKNKDSVWRSVADGIEKVARELKRARAKKQNRLP